MVLIQVKLVSDTGHLPGYLAAALSHLPGGPWTLPDESLSCICHCHHRACQIENDGLLLATGVVGAMPALASLEILVLVGSADRFDGAATRSAS